jgi:hypothetical protein
MGEASTLAKMTDAKNLLEDNLEQAYGIRAGADPNTAVYRAHSMGGPSFFVKLRRGNFNPIAVDIPKALSDEGNMAIIPPLLTIMDPAGCRIHPVFIGGGLGAGSHTPEEEETLFCTGYTQTPLNPVALAYYRYERIVQDLVDYYQQLLWTDAGGEDRMNGLIQFRKQFESRCCHRSGLSHRNQAFA